MTTHNQDPFEKILQEHEQTIAQHQEDREARIARISRDPKPEYKPPVKKDYPTTELHTLLCVDEEKANESLPIPPAYESRHKVGHTLISDRLNTPEGWIRKPANGTPIEVIVEKYPAAYAHLVEKKVTHF